MSVGKLLYLSIEEVAFKNCYEGIYISIFFKLKCLQGQALVVITSLTSVGALLLT